MDLEKKKAIEAFLNLHEAFVKIQNLDESIWEYVSFIYPFNDMDIDEVTKKVGEWVDETVYNLKNNIEVD